jgi:glycosyltransferase involved in cell wall biosynthesis
LIPRHTKILYIIDSFGIGGAERQFVRLVEGVARLDLMEIVVSYFEESDGYFLPQLTALDIPVVRIPRRRRVDISLVYRMLAYVGRSKFNLIHSFSAFSGLLAVICGKLCRTPVVASTIRDAKDQNFQTYASTRIQAMLADRLVSNSRAGIENRFRKMKSNFRVIYNGVASDASQTDERATAETRERYGLARFTRVVSMIASLSINKDYDTFIEAMPLILADEPSTGFLLVGDGSERARLENKVDRLSLRKNVVFTGYTDDVPAILSNTDIAVLMTNTRRIEEGISNSLLESMSAGVPVVACRGGGTEEVVENGVSGLLTEPYNAIDLSKAVTTLLRNQGLRQDYGEAGRLRVERKFGYDRYIKEYLALYEELL